MAVRKVLSGIRLLLSRQNNGRQAYEQVYDLEGENVQKCITDLLNNDKPCMICRFGSVELQAIVDYLYPPTAKNACRFVIGKIPSWGYRPSTLRTMAINAGFFPSTPENLNRFGELMLQSMKQVDILGSWREEERYIDPYITQVTKVPLYCLEPYYFDNPWTQALEGTKVLVIHPFEDTIRKQHAILDKLFENQKLAPKYELLTIKAVQSIAGNKPDGFSDWFEALDWMKGEIDKKDFDIAIIGCGAYGFPLAAYVKQIGKKAIHLGGAVQYLFGIRSNAADKDGGIIRPNEYWVRPSRSEIPDNIEAVEGARYW